MASVETVADVPPTNQHYDQVPAHFQCFLDPTLKYSAALFEAPDQSLHDAQLNKMAFVARSLGLSGGQRVLDVGCGWGSLTLFLATELGCQVTGVSPSPRQAEYIRERARALKCADLVSIRTGTFDAVDLPDRGFDAATMLGSITHMTDKPAAVARAYRCLKRRGRLYLSESSFRNDAIYAEFDRRAGTEFIRNTIFGWGELLPFSNYVRAAEDAGFSLQALTDLTDHYRRTIEHWKANAMRNRSKLDAVTPGKTEELVRYFDICNAGWGMTTKHYALVAQRSR